jgi:formylglycine-generating enzyme required for sulfatase activity
MSLVSTRSIDKAADIFISYAREDRERANALAEALACCGWSVWWDPRIRTGRRFDDVIAAQLAITRCVIVLWSSHSVSSPWVREEAADGRDRNILKPVLVEAVRPPLGFRSLQAADLTTWQGDEQHPGFQHLLADIRSSLSASGSRPSAKPMEARESSTSLRSREKHAQAEPGERVTNRAKPIGKPQAPPGPTFHRKQWITVFGAVLVAAAGVALYETGKESLPIFSSPPDTQGTSGTIVAPPTEPAAKPDQPAPTFTMGSSKDEERPAAVALPPRPTGPPDNADRDRGASESSEEEGAGSPPVVSTTIITQEPQTAMIKPAPSPFVAAPSRTTMRGGVFQDCSNCPPMIEVPVGSFQMGNRGEDSTEQPVHEVALKSRFAIGIREVTYGEWMACVKDQGCKHAPELTSTTDESPMRDVSWADAVQYVAWLKKTTQKPYRLPTEAEWEYAARANSSTRYWWGNDAGLVHANCKGCGGEWNRDAPLKAASYPPNPFGLYDMNGSVWEWVSDCWHSNYKGAPNDGRSWETPGCHQHVLRGGSWRDDPKLVSSFSRFYYDADIRYIANGFRVALTLD